MLLDFFLIRQSMIILPIEDEIKECRICFEQTDEKCISPCLCKGTSTWVHRRGLMQWSAITNNPVAKTQCMECKYTYKWSKPPRKFVMECCYALKYQWVYWWMLEQMVLLFALLGTPHYQTAITVKQRSTFSFLIIGEICVHILLLYYAMIMYCKYSVEYGSHVKVYCLMLFHAVCLFVMNVLVLWMTLSISYAYTCLIVCGELYCTCNLLKKARSSRLRSFHRRILNY